MVKRKSISKEVLINIPTHKIERSTRNFFHLGASNKSQWFFILKWNRKFKMKNTGTPLAPGEKIFRPQTPFLVVQPTPVYELQSCIVVTQQCSKWKQMDFLFGGWIPWPLKYSIKLWTHTSRNTTETIPEHVSLKLIQLYCPRHKSLLERGEWHHQRSEQLLT